MKVAFCFITLMSLAINANAEVYKCSTSGGGMTYSESPCSTNATVVNNLAKPPSEENVKAAQARLESNIQQVQAHEQQENFDRQQRNSQQNSRTVTVIVTRPVVVGAPIYGMSQPGKSNQNGKSHK